MVQDMGRARRSLQQGMRHIMNLKKLYSKKSFVLRKERLSSVAKLKVKSLVKWSQVELTLFLVQLFKSSLA